MGQERCGERQTVKSTSADEFLTGKIMHKRVEQYSATNQPNESGTMGCTYQTGLCYLLFVGQYSQPANPVFVL